MNVVSIVLLVIFAVMGVIAFIREVAMLMFRYKGDNTVMFITPIKKNTADAEFVLRSAVARVRWIGAGRHSYVVCLDCDMDENTKRICERICKEYGFAKLMSKSELLKELENVK